MALSMLVFNVVYSESNRCSTRGRLRGCKANDAMRCEGLGWEDTTAKLTRHQSPIDIDGRARYEA